MKKISKLLSITMSLMIFISLLPITVNSETEDEFAEKIWAWTDFSGNMSNPGGSGVQKVVDDANSEYVDKTSKCEIKDGAFVYTQNSGTKKLWGNASYICLKEAITREKIVAEGYNKVAVEFDLEINDGTSGNAKAVMASIVHAGSLYYSVENHQFDVRYNSYGLNVAPDNQGPETTAFTNFSAGVKKKITLVTDLVSLPYDSQSSQYYFNYSIYVDGEFIKEATSYKNNSQDCSAIQRLIFADINCVIPEGKKNTFILDNLKIYSSDLLDDRTVWEEDFSSYDMIINPGTVAGWTSDVYGSMPIMYSNASGGDSIEVKNGELVFNMNKSERDNETLLSVQILGNNWRTYKTFEYQFDIEFENLYYFYNGMIANLYSYEDNYIQAIQLNLKYNKLYFGNTSKGYDVKSDTKYRVRVEVDIENHKLKWYMNDTLVGDDISFNNNSITGIDRFQIWINKSSPSWSKMKIKFDNFAMTSDYVGREQKLGGKPNNYSPTVHQLTEDSIKNAVVLKENVPYAFVNNEKTFINSVAHNNNGELYLPGKFLAESFGVSPDGVDEYISVNDVKTLFNKEIFTDNGLIIVSESENVFKGNLAQNQLTHLHTYFARGIDWDTCGNGKGIYVSPDAQDGGDGSINNPFNSILKAQEEARKYKNTTGGVTVWLREGTYKLSKTWNFDSNDSATAQNPTVYRSYPGERAVITAATQIPINSFVTVTDSKVKERLLSEFSDKIRVVDLEQFGITEFPEITSTVLGNASIVNGLADVYINGRRATIARWPNNGYFKNGEVVNSGMYADDGIKSGFSFKYNDARPARWGEAKNMILFGTPVYEYTTGAFKAWVDTKNRTINTNEPYRWHIQSGKNYYVYNLLEEIDVEGEYFVDTIDKKLYILPPDDMEKVEIATADFDLLNVINAKEIYFRDITFKGTNGNGINLINTDGIMFLGCTINNVGKNGILGNNVSNTGIEGCDIFDISYIGISLSGGKLKTLTPSGNYIENCNIYRTGNADLYSQAIEIKGMGGRVSNCQIHDLPSSAIRGFENDCIIEYNDIYNVLKNTKDMGAIYRCGSAVHNRGNAIRHNLIHNIAPNPEVKPAVENSTPPVAGVYIDMSSCGDVVYGNVFYDFFQSEDSASYSILFNGGRDFDVYNNVFIGDNAKIYSGTTGKASTEGAMHRGYAENWDYDYSQEPHKSHYAEASALTLKDIELNRSYNNNFYNNLMYNSQMHGYGTYSAYSKNKDNYEIYENPGFVDIENDNFTLKADSSVFSNIKDFKNIQTQSAGIYMGEYRNTATSIDDYREICPANNSNNVQVTGNMFLWSYAPNADKYQLVVSTDENFSDIIINEEIKSFRTAQKDVYYEDLSKIQYGKKTYYWKLTAYSYDKSIAPKEIGPFKFTTADKEIIVTDNMDNMVDYAQNIINNAVEGENIGEYPSGSKNVLQQAVNTAKSAYNTAVTQADFDEKTSEFIKAIENFENGVVCKAPDVTNIVEWLGDKKGWWDAGSVQKYAYAYNYPIGHWTGCELTIDSVLTMSCMGYVRRNQRYDEVIKADVAFCFDGKSEVIHQVGMMMNQFDLGNSTTPWNINTGYPIYLYSDGHAIVKKYKDGKDCGEIASIPAGTIKDGVSYQMEFGVVKESGGNRITWTVDGNSLVNYLDNSDPVRTTGYLMFIDGGPKASYLSDEDGIKIIISGKPEIKSEIKDGKVCSQIISDINSSAMLIVAFRNGNKFINSICEKVDFTTGKNTYYFDIPKECENCTIDTYLWTDFKTLKPVF